MCHLGLIFWLRWNEFKNSVLRRHGLGELVTGLLLLALGGLAALMFAAVFARKGYQASTAAHPGHVVVQPLWGLFFFLQIAPILKAALPRRVNFGELARYPIRLRVFYALNLLYGLADPFMLAGFVWTLALGLGIAWRFPACAAPTAGLLGLFFLTNLLLAQLSAQGLDELLRKRRRREIFLLTLFLTWISAQFLIPLNANTVNPPDNVGPRLLNPLLRVFPPALTARGLEAALKFQQPDMPAQFVRSAVALLATASLLAAGLWLALRRSYLGETAAEEGPAASVTGEQQVSWNLPWLAPATAGVFEKELRYAWRNPQTALTWLGSLAMPIFLLLAWNREPRPQQGPAVEFLVFLLLASLVFFDSFLLVNQFGFDGAGFRSFLLAPISFRQVMLGKNLAAGVMVIAQLGTLLATLSLSRFHFRGFEVALGVLVAAYLLAVVLGAGNLLSVYFPLKAGWSGASSSCNAGAAGRRGYSWRAALSILCAQALAAAPLAALFLAAIHIKARWLLLAGSLLLLAVGVRVYLGLLSKAASAAEARREALLAELA